MLAGVERTIQFEKAELNLRAVTGMSSGEVRRLGRMYGLSGLVMAHDLAAMGEPVDSIELLLSLGITPDTVYWFRTVGHTIMRPSTPGKYVVGDTSCKNNARSPDLRCAVNPCGPCDGCADFEPWD